MPLKPKKLSEKKQLKNYTKPVQSGADSNAINYKLISVKDIEFQCTSFKSHFKSPFVEENLRVSYNWSAHGVKKDKVIKLQLGVLFAYKTEQELAVLVNYVSETSILIANFDDVFKNESSGALDLNNNFIIHCIGISISTARGILIEKLANTEYRNLILPIVGTSKLVEIFQNGLIKK